MKARTIWKKSVSLLLTFCMIVSLFGGITITASAEEGGSDGVAMTPVVFTTKEVEQNGVRKLALTVTLTDEVANVTEVQIKLYFDKAAFDIGLADHEATSIVTNANRSVKIQPGDTDDSRKLTIGASSGGSTPFAGTGELCTFYFTILEGAKGNYNFTVVDSTSTSWFNGYYSTSTATRTLIPGATIPVTIAESDGGDEGEEGDAGVAMTPVVFTTKEVEQNGVRKLALTVTLTDEVANVTEVQIKLYFDKAAFDIGLADHQATSIVTSANRSVKIQPGDTDDSRKLTIGASSGGSTPFAGTGELCTFYFTILEGAKGNYNFTVVDSTSTSWFNGYYSTSTATRTLIPGATIPVTIAESDGGDEGGGEETEAPVSIVATAPAATPGRSVPVTFNVTAPVGKNVNKMVLQLKSSDNFYVTWAQLVAAGTASYVFGGLTERQDHLGFSKFHIQTSFGAPAIGTGTFSVTVNLTVPKNATPGTYDILDAAGGVGAITFLAIDGEGNAVRTDVSAQVSGQLTIGQPKADPITFEAKTANGVVALKVFCADAVQAPRYVRLQISNVPGLTYAAVDSGAVLTAAGLTASVQDYSESSGFIRVNLGDYGGNTAFTGNGELCTLYFTGTNPDNKIELDKVTLPSNWVMPLTVNSYWQTVGSEDQIDLGGTVIPIVAGSSDNVAKPVTGITLNKTTASLYTTGAAEPLTATVAPADASRNTVVWISSNSAVAKVSSTGLVTPVAAGTATISAKSVDGSGIQAQCTVSVVAGVTGLSVSGATMRVMGAGKTDTIVPEIIPANAHNKNLTWTSSNEGVATVANGVVTAVAEGEATITATTEDGGYTAAVKYRVGPDTLENAAAKIGTVEYASFAEALSALNGGETIVLLQDTTETAAVTANKNFSLNLGGKTLKLPTLTISGGAEVRSISGGAIIGNLQINIDGLVEEITGCTITGNISVGQSSKDGGHVELIDGCTVTGLIRVYGELVKLSNCTVNGLVQAQGYTYNGVNHFALIRGIYDCTVTVTNNNESAVKSLRADLYLYSGTYTNLGTRAAVTAEQGGNAFIYGGKFKTAGTVSVLGSGQQAAKVVNGYKLSETADADGYYEVTPEILDYITTFQLTPADAVISVLKKGSATPEAPLVDASLPAGAHSYKVEKGVEYSFTVSRNDYKTQTGQFQMEGNTTLTIPITLQSLNGPGVPGDLAVKGGDVITDGGTYKIADNANGVITILTKKPVTLIGNGISEADAKFSDLSIECAVSGADLTIHELWINNNVGQGTSSGETNRGDHLINFIGQNNTLHFTGQNLLENQEYVESAGIHVPKGASLTIDGTGTLYFYKYSEGAGIGGNGYEASGTITFAGGDIFIKGSKTGPLIGGDSMMADMKNDSIYITGGNLVLINKAQGAAIGASRNGTGAGAVYLQGGNLTIITDYLGSAIGYGGQRLGTPGTLYVSGGSFKAVRTSNSLYGNSSSEAQYVNDSLVTAEKRNGNGSGSVSRLIFDTETLSKKNAVYFNVSTSTGFTYSGGLHQYRYTETTSSTVDNFGFDDSDKNLYFYLPTQNQTLTVNGEKFEITWNAASQSFTVKNAAGDTVSGDGSGGLGKDEQLLSESADQLVVLSPKAEAKNGTASVSVSKSDIDAALKQADASDKLGVAIVPEITGTNVASVKAELPKSAVQAISEADKGLIIKTPVGNLTFDAATLAAIAAEAKGSNVTLSISTVAPTALTDGQKKAAPDRPVVELTVLSDGKAISDFKGGRVTVSIPYTLRAGEVPEGVLVYFLADDASLTKEASRYNTATGRAEFAVTHFSKYVIAYEEPADAWKNPFGDVKYGDWFYDAIKYVHQKKLMTGTGATAFSPSANMSRAMLGTVLYRMAEEPTVAGANPFHDVAAGQWYTNAVIWANEQDIVKGYGGGVFGTNDSITREQAAAMFYRYAQTMKWDVSAKGDLSQFIDGGKTSVWAADAMRWAVGSELLKGTGAAVLNPQGTASRAEVATMLMRLTSLTTN